MTLSARRLGPDDAEAARQLGMEAFEVPSSPPTSSATIDQPGMIWFGAFEDDLLVARLVDREYAYRAVLSMIGSAQSCANLRLAGHLAGGDLNQDLDWDAMLGGRQRHIRDYF